MSAQATTSYQDPSGVLDPDALARLSELDPQGSAGLVRRVLSTYATSLERAREELRRVREPVQPEALRHLTHTLKSSSASVGALALSALCAQIEREVRTPQMGDITTQLDAMQAEMARVSGALQAMLGP